MGDGKLVAKHAYNRGWNAMYTNFVALGQVCDEKFREVYGFKNPLEGLDLEKPLLNIDSNVVLIAMEIEHLRARKNTWAIAECVWDLLQVEKETRLPADIARLRKHARRSSGATTPLSTSNLNGRTRKTPHSWFHLKAFHLWNSASSFCAFVGPVSCFLCSFAHNMFAEVTFQGFCSWRLGITRLD